MAKNITEVDSKVKKTGYKKIKEYTIRKGLYPINVALTIWDDGESSPYIDLYSGVPVGDGYKHNHFKIPNKMTWYKIKKIIDEELINDIKKGKPLSEKVVEKQINEEIERLKEDIFRMGKTLQANSQLIKEYRNIRIPDYKEDIQQFESLIISSKKEKELQKFLSQKPWLLGLEYETAKPQKVGPGQRYDFYVEKYDGYADIIEIKRVNEDIFNADGKITIAFSNALQQLIDYIDDASYYGNDKRLSEKMDFNFLKPKGILIMGRNREAEKLKNLKYYFHNIEILTYDDVLERSKSILNHLQNNASKMKKSIK